MDYELMLGVIALAAAIVLRFCTCNDIDAYIRDGIPRDEIRLVIGITILVFMLIQLTWIIPLFLTKDIYVPL